MSKNLKSIMKVRVIALVYFLVCLLLATLIHSCAFAKEGYTLADFYEEYSKSVVQVCSGIDCDSGKGSGVYIESDVVMTNFHVIRSVKCIYSENEDGIFTNDCSTTVSKQVRIRTDKGNYIADIIRYFPEIDIAILKLNKYGHGKPILLGNSDKIRIGDTAITIGS